MMEDFVTYDQAVKLKELGFDWECNHYYRLNTSLNKQTKSDYFNFNHISYLISAPTLAQVQKWLREVKGITVLVNIATNEETYITKKVFYFKWFNSEFILCGISKYHYATYEEALLEGISEVLKMIEHNEL